HGSIRWNGRELIGASEREIAHIRGNEIGMVFQEPRTALNPIRRIGRQMSEPARIHRRIGRDAAAHLAVDLARQVALAAPDGIVARYPHQLSGGQRQRAALAMALANDPELLIADEPTTALDVTIQAEVLALMTRLADERGMSLLFITHDLAVLAQIATHAVVLKRGRVVESGDVDTLLTAPAHEVTRGLLRDATATTWRPDGGRDE